MTSYKFLHLNSNLKIWYDNLCDLQLLIGWHKFPFDRVIKFVCGVGSAHKLKATSLEVKHPQSCNVETETAWFFDSE